MDGQAHLVKFIWTITILNLKSELPLEFYEAGFFVPSEKEVDRTGEKGSRF